MEQAAASLGAGPLTIFRRIILPNLFPAIVSGAALAFARALGEFGSVVLISGNLPVQDRGRLGLHRGQIESGDQTGAAAVSVALLVVALAGARGVLGAQPLGVAPCPLARRAPAGRCA